MKQGESMTYESCHNEGRFTSTKARYIMTDLGSNTSPKTQETKQKEIKNYTMVRLGKKMHSAVQTLLKQSEAATACLKVFQIY